MIPSNTFGEFLNIIVILMSVAFPHFTPFWSQFSWRFLTESFCLTHGISSVFTLLLFHDWCSLICCALQFLTSVFLWTPSLEFLLDLFICCSVFLSLKFWLTLSCLFKSSIVFHKTLISKSESQCVSAASAMTVWIPISNTFFELLALSS